MARHAKTEVAAINLRIPDTHNRDYVALIEYLAGLRRGVQVFGDQFVALSHFDKDRRIGILSKYTEIDLDGDWFDIDDFDLAEPEEIKEISIPKNLKPNLSQFYLEINQDVHCCAFQTYSDSKAISARSVEKYFRDALASEDARNRFGLVEVDVVKSYDEVERLLELPDLREIHFEIRRPNEDDLSKTLAAAIEAALSEQGADELHEVIKAAPGHAIKPNKRTKALGIVAAENGHVTAKSIVKGVLTNHNTDEAPLKEVATIAPDESELGKFRQLASALFKKISAARS